MEGETRPHTFGLLQQTFRSSRRLTILLLRGPPNRASEFITTLLNISNNHLAGRNQVSLNFKFLPPQTIAAIKYRRKI